MKNNFIKQWFNNTGILLTLFIRFRKHIKDKKTELIMAGICSADYAIMRLLEPWPIKIIIDNILLDHPLYIPFYEDNLLDFISVPWLLIYICIGIVLIAILKGTFYFYQAFLMSQVGQELVFRLRRHLFSHIQRLSMSFHDRRETGDLMMRLTGDILMLREMLVASSLIAISESLAMVGMGIIMLLLNWKLTLISLSVIPTILILLNRYTGKIREAAKKQRKREGKVASMMHESISAIRIVQAFTRENYEDERFKLQNKRSMNAGLRSSWLEAKFNRSIEIALAVGICFVILFGTIEVLLEQLTPGELLVFIAYVRGFYRPLRKLSSITERSVKATACGERVLEILDTEPLVKDLKDAIPVEKLRGDVHFHHVHFAYDTQMTLEDIDFDVKSGERIAFVGPTGAGKSTLISLIPRFYDPLKGKITIDGENIKRYTINSLREQISLVTQESVLFRSSIRENIAYGKIKSTNDEIIEAAKQANAHEFILDLPEGYDTVIGERGGTLSGGQRQCIAIARAILRNAPILILDEPTTGLDSKSERMVLEALDRLMIGRTCFIIAHRFSTIREADQIYVLEHGRIIDRGTHSELINRQGKYRDFFELQIHDFAPHFIHEKNIL